MSPPTQASTAVSRIMATCAVIVTVLLLHREFPGGGRTVRLGTSIGTPSQPVKNWQQYVREGHWEGDTTAQVVLVEFGDFECPACGDFEQRALKPARANHPRELAVVFRHWPLTYHRFAYPAARAAECAADQGRFAEFHDLLYAKQDSLGLKSFEAFAKESGVSDPVAYTECLSRSSAVPRIEQDVAAVRKLGGHGTPTLLMNGMLLGEIPDSATFERMIVDALKSKAGQGGE